MNILEELWYGNISPCERDFKKGSKYSELLGDSIASIIEVKDENDMDSFLSGKQMSFLSETINGLDDFELISFLVIK